MQNSADEHPVGELAFAYLLFFASVWAFWAAYQINGFGKWSDPGTMPLMGTGIMIITSAINVFKCHRIQRSGVRRSFWQDLAPPAVIIFSALSVTYAVVFELLGFVLSSFVFMVVCFALLGKQSIGRSVLLSAGVVLAVYIVFRLLFLVLLPEGFLPEREFLAKIDDLISGR